MKIQLNKFDVIFMYIQIPKIIGQAPPNKLMLFFCFRRRPKFEHK